jgi:phosphoserine phosphatase
MRIAVFLDVDNTLTEDFIQQQYAQALDCVPEYRQLEAQFERNLDSQAFGDAIVKLFAPKNFTEKKAKEVYEKVRKQAWTDELLKRSDIDKYLVSSGPSYYIDQLAKEYDIPPENILCSIYLFSHEAPYTIESCKAVSNQKKAEFVAERKGKYDISIGVGDSERNDGPFLSQVTIPLLRARGSSYISFSEFQSVNLVINSLLKIAQAEVPDGELLELVKAKCKQNPKLIEDIQKTYPSEPVDLDSYIQSLSIGKTLTLLKNKSLPTILGWLAGIFTAGFGAGVVIGKLVGGIGGK